MNRNSITGRSLYIALEGLRKFNLLTEKVYKRFKRLYFESSSKNLKRTSNKTYNVRSEPSLDNLEATFVLSTGRCGTATLAALLGLLPNVRAFHELQPDLRVESFLFYMNHCPTLSKEFWLDLISDVRDMNIRYAYWTDRVYFESNNRLTLLSELLVEHYPQSRFIHVVRHPLYFVRSGMRRGYYYSAKWDYIRILPQANDPVCGKWPEMSEIEKCSWLWARTNNHILKVLKSVPEERKLFVKSEDVFAGDYKTIEKIIKFVTKDSIFPPKREIDKLLGLKMNYQRSGEFPDPSDWDPKDIDTVMKYVHNLISEFGYEI